VAAVEGGNYPQSAFVGDGILPPYALIDLNNVFGRQTNMNLDLSGGGNLTLINFRGMLGNAAVTHRVPADSGMCEIKSPDAALIPGWNMMSLALEPVNPATAEVLASIGGQFDCIWTYETDLVKWLRYCPGGPPFLNDLQEMHSRKGYWLVMNGMASLKVEGDFPAGGIPIYADWNLVSYGSMESWETVDALAGMTADLNCLWTYETDIDKWRRYCPGGPPFLNDLNWVVPGRGYWVDAIAEGTW
jgi:hypothetical protein